MPPPRKPEGDPSPLTFFATELRRRREQFGWSQGQLGQQITYSIGLISMVETAQRTPSLDFVERCDQALKAEGALTRIWPLLAYSVFPPRFRPWVDVERNAETLRSWDPLLVPGLLQTPATPARFWRPTPRRRTSASRSCSPPAWSARSYWKARPCCGA